MYTFTSTAAVIIHLGARPVLVDVDPATLTMDPDDVARKITSRTRAIIPVHMAGTPCDMDPLLELASRRDHGGHRNDRRRATSSIHQGTYPFRWVTKDCH